MEEAARDPDREAARGVEAEEKDAGSFADGDVGAQVEFQRFGDTGQRGRAAQADAGHSEWHYGNPRFAIESIDLQRFRNPGTELLYTHRPVGEQEIAPLLR